MEFSVKQSQPEKQRSACVVLPIFDHKTLSDTASKFDTLSNGFITQVLRKGDLEGKIGQTILLHNPPNLQCDRLLLIGCGKEKELSDTEFRDICKKAILALIPTSATEAVFYLTEAPVKGRDVRWKVRQAVEITHDTLYLYEQFKSKKDKERKSLKRIVFTVPSRKDLNAAVRGMEEGLAISHAIELTKNLGNLPPNICTPAYLGKEAEALAKRYPAISAAILDEKELKALKMGSLLSVGQGSINPPRLITLEYQGRKDKQKPIVLVGKGITFDTGGNSLKPAAAMIGMKYDMCGGASVLAALQAAAELELPINLVGVIPSAENMPGNQASRPDDIVTSMSGMTIEILNTDAEGRLILADALTYCERFNPEVVIDIATLTGAALVALGRHASAMFSNYAPLANELLNAGLASGDRCWQLPLWEEYLETLSSNFADIANIGPMTGTPEAGTILGACFLSRFTEKYHWAHLDVAATAFRSSGKERGATGRPVSLLVQFLLDRC